jgi:hypothetical protein
VYEFAVAWGVLRAKLRVEESMRGEDVRKVFESILPDAVLVELARSHKLLERERKLDVVRLVRAMVIAAATGRNLSTRMRQRSREFYEGSSAIAMNGV